MSSASASLPRVSSVQVNVRFDGDAIRALDAIAADEGSSRADVVRKAVLDRLKLAAAAKDAAAYEQAYKDFPETDEEVDRATASALRLTSDEPWDRWW